jgi:hypothetical protein
MPTIKSLGADARHHALLASLPQRAIDTLARIEDDRRAVTRGKRATETTLQSFPYMYAADRVIETHTGFAPERGVDTLAVLAAAWEAQPA